MGYETMMCFKARISSHGRDKYIINIPKALVHKAEELHRSRKEVVVIVYEIENP